MQDLDLIRLLVDQLNIATKQYDEGQPIMEDAQWDTMYFRLQNLEHETGIVLPDSPTQKIVYQSVNQLDKIKHGHSMLSLDKTKDISEVKAFLGDVDWVAMFKMDGLTCSLTYENTYLVSAETRGNGEVGENILHNALVIPSIPNRIPCKEKVVIDGEIICTDKDFEPFSQEYKNSRNFAAGSIRLLDSKECASRHLNFIAWDMIEGYPEENSFLKRLYIAQTLGFFIVPTYPSSEYKNNLDVLISQIKDQAQSIGYPIDGIVFKFDDVAYGKTLGQTAHHFKNAIAYKFYDETYESKLIDIEWTMGRTGQLTPVAVFEPIDMDGSIVERANLHNISIMEGLLESPYVGQKVQVYKANQIIPQIASAEKWEVGVDHQSIPIPQICPVCGQPTTICRDGVSEQLFCLNPDCSGKLINQLDHFCGKKGLDIKGLSKATLGKLIDWGWVFAPSDLFTLSTHREEWMKKPGFGIKSVDNILNSIEVARTTTLDKFISALGIPFIGQTLAKDLVKYIPTYEEFRHMAQTKGNFSLYPGFADSKTFAIWNYDFTEADRVYPYLVIRGVEPTNVVPKTLDGVTVVITGKLNLYKNRAELQEAIAAAGGKVTGTVSKNTTYLINNDNTSTSSKNLTAQKLGVEIITEQDFVSRFLTK